MAGRYPPKLDKESASLSPATSTPISYRANVNRQKTKKWADAKPADYGGDDWGDDDEYDLPPPPVAKPTGLRQQGQALNSGPKPDTPPTDVKKSYSDLPPVPGSATLSRPRTNSFDADDEKRNFSSGVPRQPSPQPGAAKPPATRFSQITGVPSTRDPGTHPALLISTQLPTQPAVTGLRKAIPTPSPSATSQPDGLQLGRNSTADSSSIVSSTADTGTPSDYQTRRDFSPSAVPSPLQTRASPEPPAAKPTERKGSLAQSQGTDVSESAKSPQATVTPKPWASGQPSSPSTAVPGTQGKALPFIRPADIYRRMEEARERERQSTESSRRSMESITDAKSSDKSDSPAQRPLDAKSSSDSSGMGSRHRLGSEADDNTDSGHLRTTLEPVRERKSEYGFDGFQLNDPSGPDAHETSDFTSQDALEAEIERHQSTSPQLPNLNRLSGFGVEFLSQSKSGVAEQPASHPSETTPTLLAKESPVPGEDPTLRNQPSLGFKSAVSQAFDRPDRSSDTSLPATPASRTNSGIKRSESESTGTTGISPIMSRVPSTAIPASLNRDVGPESSSEDNHQSGSLPPVHESAEGNEQLESPSVAPTFKPGHRRDISTPSPGNSPARTPDLSKSKIETSAQQVVLSQPSLPSASGADGREPSQPSHLGAERDQSTRLVSPSGWSSSDQVQAPDTEVLRRQEERDEKYDITPATIKNTLPRPSSEATGVAASLSSAAGAAAGKHDQDIAVGAAAPSSLSINSSEAPAPPTKDAPKDQEAGTPPPMDKTSLVPPAKNESLAASASLPTLTLATGSVDEQNDNLHKDSAQRLSSQLDASAQENLLMPENSDDLASFNQARISSYLPSEYENYWASSAEEETPEPLGSDPLKKTAKETVSSQALPITVTEPHPYGEPEPIQPLSPRRPEQTLSSLGSPVSHRFSWEASSEDVSALSARQGEPHLPHEAPQGARDVGESAKSEDKSIRRAAEEVQSNSKEPADDHTGRDLAMTAGGVSFPGTVTAMDANQTDSDNQFIQRVSTADESDPNASTHPALRLPSEDEHPDPSLQPQVSPTIDQQSNHSASVPPRSISSSQSAPVAKIPTFKEIAAIESPQQRIQTFDETRQRFAGMDSGLSSWMETLKAQYPEHANVSSSFVGSRMSLPSGAARSKNPNSSVQQPYYQQYLNASSPSARSGPNAQSGSQQGSSPASSSKLSTQQVQAKGKELLQTAGIFGGKAGKAGKGLLAKGKSRLRGGDKTPTSQGARADRRSSWGLPLTRPRSSSRSNPPSRHSGESSSTEMPQRRRASTLSLDTNPAPAHRPSAGDIVSAPGHMIAPWTGTRAFLPGQSAEFQPVPQAPQLLMSTQAPPVEEPMSDDLDIPAPIGKNQPSWDPYNATPIIEEEGFHDEGRPRRQSHPMNPGASPPALAVPDETVSENERSHSEGGLLARGHEPPDGDWILISSEVEPNSNVLQQLHPAGKDLDPNPGLTVTKSPEESLAVPLAAVQTRNRGNSSTSILDRPRYSYDIPRPGEDPAPPAQTNKPLPEIYFPSLIDSPDKNLNVKQVKAQNSKSTSKNKSSFRGLPPIRRISGIELDFIPGQPTTKSPINHKDNGHEDESENVNEHEDESENGDEHEDESENDDEDEYENQNDSDGEDEIEGEFEHEEDNDPFHSLERRPYPGSSEAEISAALRAAAGLTDDETDQGVQLVASHVTQPPQTQARQMGPPRPPIGYAVSPMHTNDPLRQNRENQAEINTGRGPHFPTSSGEGFKGSDDTWVPPPGRLSDRTISPQRRSLISPSTRGHMHGQSFLSRTDTQDERQWRNSWNPPQPPSSAQRYPELFRPEVTVLEKSLEGGEDLPPQYYQPPIPQEAAFMPRQQPNEYQLRGVGPPPDVERPGSRRNSGFFKEIGDRIRTASRDEGKPIPREGALPSEKNTDSMREYDDTASSIVSEDTRDPTKRRNSFFAGFNRVSSSGAGSARDSMVAHPAASRMDLTLPPQSSASQERKRSIFGTSSPIKPVPKLNRLAVPASPPVSEEPGKKRRFSGLSNMFGKSSSHSQKSSISESIRERPSIERPAEVQLSKPAQILGVPSLNTPRNFLSRLTASGDAPEAKQDNKATKPKLRVGSDSSQLRPEYKTRKPAGAALFAGFMGKGPIKQEKPNDPPPQGIRSKIGPPIYHPPQFFVSRTTSDLGSHTLANQNQHAANPLLPQNSQPEDREYDRGRRFSGERQYPIVPIPNGYSLVRGEGATPVRTEYDPRGLNIAQQTDPSHAQESRQSAGHLYGPQFRGNGRHSSQDLALSQGSRSPNLTIESSEDSQRRDLRRISREDMLARSPARSPEGQQRPYQLSLPEDNEDRGQHPTALTTDVPVISPPRKVQSSAPQPEKAKVATIQRLKHPVLRHPESPAGYPLPEDDVFSPVNRTTKDLPPPPAPEQQGAKSNSEREDKPQPVLGRRNRVRGKSKGEIGLAATDTLDKERGRALEITPSPSPPAAGTTLPRPSENESEISLDSSTKALKVEGRHMPNPDPKPSPDLYSASPRLPKLANGEGSVGKDDKEVKDHTGVKRGSRSSAHPAELDDPESHMLRRARGTQEEKIPAEEDRLGEGDIEPVTMTATSYPGQEWNPYASGGFDECD